MMYSHMLMYGRPSVSTYQILVAAIALGDKARGDLFSLDAFVHGFILLSTTLKIFKSNL